MMTVPAIHCEARKIAYRQTKEGLVVAFVIHPNDMPDSLAIAPLGQRYMLALAAIDDDEQPITGKEVVPDTQPAPRDNVSPPSYGAGVSEMTTEAVLPTEGGARPTVVQGADGPQRDGSSVSRSQRERERYQASPPQDQALIRSGRLPTDPRFQNWVAGKIGRIADYQDCRQYIRDECCESGSRARISEDKECYRRFLELEMAFKIQTGQMAEARG